MATNLEIREYMWAVRQELALYGHKLSIMHQHGDKPDFSKEIKFMLLEAYVDIADKYLYKYGDAKDNNFFTVAEFNSIMRHINTIANSYHWLELE